MRMFRVLAAAAALVITGFAGAAKAAWLDLADGTYNVTLNCTFSSVIACPSSINGTITVDGAGLNFMDFLVNGQQFAGDPTDGVHSSQLADYQYSDITLFPYAFFSIRNDLSIPFGMADHWWVYCDHGDPSISGCLLRTGGTWVATLVPSEVPEPAGFGLVALGLALAARSARLARRYTSTSLQPRATSSPG